MSVVAQSDSLVFVNSNIIVGEIQKMEKGVLEIETDYSDDDFKIEWKEIKEIYLKSRLYISLTDGEIFYGTLRTVSDSVLQITENDSIIRDVKKDEVVHLLLFEEKFIDRLDAEIDVGFGLAQSNNLRQLTSASMLGYHTKKMRSHITFNTLQSHQDEIDPIKRIESEFVFQYILRNNWYLIPSVNYLSNTEQKLKYRWNLQLGIGNYLIRTNQAYWGVKAGLNSNQEAFTDGSDDNQSWEGLFGTELNLFDTGDLNIFTTVIAYPGITEKGRWRTDANLKFKYDLPLDFYVKIDFSANYDNMPREGANDIDFVTTFGVGWEL